MKKVYIFLILLVLLLMPAQGVFASETDEGYFIQDYHVEVVVGTDRGFEVTETIDVWFSERSRGIFREIPTYSAVESYTIVDLRAVGDPFVTESVGKIRIGDSDIYLEGQKTYTIKYRLEHWADVVPDADYFYFDVIGTKWDTRIENFSARITLPDGAVVEEYTLTGGQQGNTDWDHFANVEVEGNIILLEGNVSLPARNGVTLNVRMPEGTFYDAGIWVPPLVIDSLFVAVLIDKYGVVTVEENYTVTVNEAKGFFRGLRDYDGYGATPSYKVANQSVTGPDGRVSRNYSEVDLYGYVGQTVDFSINYVLKNRLHEDRTNVEFLLSFMNSYDDKRVDSMNVVIEAPFDISGFFNDWSGEGILGVPVIDGTRLTVSNIEPFFNQRVDYVVKFEDGGFIRRLTVMDFALPGGLILGAILMLYYAFRHKREKMMVPTIEFYPPQGMSPAVVGYIIDDHISGRDVTSLIYFWASHGHLNIEMTGEKTFKLHKLSELDETHPDYERDMFLAMWALGEGGTVTDGDLKEKFYTSVTKAISGVRDSFSGSRGLYVKGRKNMATKFGLLMAPVFIVLLCFANLYWTFVDDLAFMIGTVFVFCLLVLIFAASYRAGTYQPGKSGIFKPIICIVLSVLGTMFFGGIMGFGYAVSTVSALISGAAIFVITYAAPFLVRRSDFGVDLLGKCVGFRTFLVTAEKSRIEMLLAENPDYYYNILPYAQVLKVTKVWQKKFDGLLISPPSWCYGTGTDWDHRAFDISSMSRIMDTMGSNMTSSPSSSGGGGSGGGSFSSGGSSGGGSGGGGGGRW